MKLHEKLANEKKELEQEIQQEEEQRQQEKALLKRMESRTLEAKRVRMENWTCMRIKSHHICCLGLDEYSDKGTPCKFLENEYRTAAFIQTGAAKR